MKDQSADLLLIAEAIEAALVAPPDRDSNGEPLNVPLVINRLAEATQANAAALRLLGTGDAATSMGAIEALAGCVKDAGIEIAEALHHIAEALEARVSD